MDYFGINTTEDLPRIKEIIHEEIIEPTAVQDSFHPEDTDLIPEASSETLAVTEDGSLITENQETPPANNPENSSESTENEDES